MTVPPQKAIEAGNSIVHATDRISGVLGDFLTAREGRLAKEAELRATVEEQRLRVRQIRVLAETNIAYWESCLSDRQAGREEAAERRRDLLNMSAALMEHCKDLMSLGATDAVLVQVQKNIQTTLQALISEPPQSGSAGDLPYIS